MDKYLFIYSFLSYFYRREFIIIIIWTINGNGNYGFTRFHEINVV